jgi:dTDP-4-dehydrorhamnose reductase
MRILVTGGGGFLGGCMSRKLHERSDPVIVLKRMKGLTSVDSFVNLKISPAPGALNSPMPGLGWDYKRESALLHSKRALYFFLLFPVSWKCTN